MGDLIFNVKTFIYAQYGCQDPTEAIKQFQMFLCGINDDYNPQTMDFDYAMRWHLIAELTYMQYQICPSDVRDTIAEAEEKCQNHEFAIQGMTMLDNVPGRMSEEGQLNPPVYVTPISDEVYEVEEVHQYPMCGESIDYYLDLDIEELLDIKD